MCIESMGGKEKVVERRRSNAQVHLDQLEMISDRINVLHDIWIYIWLKSDIDI